jgi:hypothetical protein
MKTIPPRIIIYPKDVVNITGRSERTARKLIQKVRLIFGKSPDEFVTVKEFCTVFGIEESHVKDYLKD